MSNGRTTDIPPALTDEDWSVREHHSRGWDGSSLVLSDFGLSVIQSGPATKVSDLAALIALANDAMNSEDPRKFGRVHVLSLRGLAGDASDIAGMIAPQPQRDGERQLLERSAEFLNDLADVLESYLPRDPTTRRAKIKSSAGANLSGAEPRAAFQRSLATG